MSSLLSRLLPRTSANPSTSPATPPSPADLVASLTKGKVGDYLAEDEVANERLLTLFKQAFIPVEVVSAHHLRVTSESGIKMHVAVDSGRKLISLVTTFGLREDAPMEQKLQLCNRINDSVIFVRLSVTDATTLCSDHALPFNGGICSASIISAVRLLARVTVQSLADMDEHRLVR